MTSPIQYWKCHDRVNCCAMPLPVVARLLALEVFTIPNTLFLGRKNCMYLGAGKKHNHVLLLFSAVGQSFRTGTERHTSQISNLFDGKNISQYHRPAIYADWAC